MKWLIPPFHTDDFLRMRLPRKGDDQMTADLLFLAKVFADRVQVRMKLGGGGVPCLSNFLEDWILHILSPINPSDWQLQPSERGPVNSPW